MKLNKRGPVAEPLQHRLPFQPRRLVREHRLVRRIRVLAKVGDEPVLLRVKVDVPHQRRKVAVGCDRDPAKAFLEQAAGAPIGLVDGLGVTVEKVGELLRGV